jgi:hypothetical protein
MTDEKPKNENTDIEWSFDFAKLGESFRKLLESLAGEEEIKTTEIEIGKGSATRADVELKYSVGQGTLKALPAVSNSLLEGAVVHVGDLNIDASGETVKRVKIEQKLGMSAIAAPIRQGFRALANRDELRWDMGLAPNVPISLDLNGGVGRITADLSGLTLTQLNVENGVGQMNITLPATDAGYTTKIKGGVGETNITVPYGASGKIKVDGGVGAVEIIVPANLAVRLKAEQGIGSVSVPAGWELVRGGEFMGKRVYETDGYEVADKHLEIHYDGGVGQLRVRVLEMV